MRCLLTALFISVFGSSALAAQDCLPCIQKCSICFNAGKSTFPSIAACEANCRQNGNRPAIATCGVRAACPANKR
jgi:hypothetical protein